MTTAAIRYWARGDGTALVTLLDGRPDLALIAAEHVLGELGAEAEAITAAAAVAIVAASLLGSFDRAEAAAERIRGAEMSWAVLGQARCLSLILAGRVGEALGVARRGAGDAGRPAGGWSVLLGMLARLRGDPAAATAATSRPIDGLLAGSGLAELAAAYALAGDDTAANRTLLRANGLPRAGRVFDAWLGLSQAWTTVAVGDGTLAARQAGRAAAAAMATGQVTVEALARYDVARFGDPAAVRQRLAALAGRIDGGFVSIMAGAAAGLADGDATALDRATEAFAERGADLFAAETATVAAALHRRAGRVALAGRAAARAARACPGASTPLLRLTAELLALTRRERDVALLAADGLTSQAIGERLRLSVRTVDNYLGRVYQKVGVANRRGLSRLVRPARGRVPVPRSHLPAHPRPAAACRGGRR